MTTIIEIRSDKIDKMSEYTEHILRYGGKMMQCLDEIQHSERKELRDDSHTEDEHRSRYL